MVHRFRYLTLLALTASLIVLGIVSSGGAVNAAAANNGGGFRALSGDDARGFTVPADMQLMESFRMDPHGLTYERYQQYFSAAEVLGGQITLFRDDSGVIVTVIGAHYPDIVPTNLPGLTQADARRVAERDVGPPEQALIDLVIDPESGRHFFRVESRSLDSRWFHWIDAASGQVLNRYDALETDHGIGVKGDAKSMSGLTTLHSRGRPSLRGYWFQSSGNRQLTYDDANNGGSATIMIDSDNHWDLLGRNSPGQPAGVDAHYYANVTDDYYLTVHGRDSFDNNGAAMKSIVHIFANNYNNAFWNGNVVAYGDGDGVNFSEFSGGLDVVGHELTHAVTDFTSDLIYQNQSGALNESFSDQMGNSIEFFADANGLDPTVAPDWLIAEDISLFADTQPGFRNMADPEEDGDPDHFKEFLVTNSDNGGVHTNSGIPNHAYYLLVNGGPNASCASPGDHNSAHCNDGDTQDNNLNVTTVGLADAEQIFFLGFTALNQDATMCDARAATEATAVTQFGSGSQQAQSTSDAWVAVGLTDAECGTTPGTADPSTSTITADPTSIPADGSSTSAINVQLKDANANNLTTGGDTVTLSTNLGSLGPVSDNNDGTYTATLTAGTTAGTATITGTVNTEAITDTATVTFTEPAEGPTVSKIVIKVEQKGPNHQAVAEVHSDKGVTVSGDFFYPVSTTFLNSDSDTVGGRGFAKLESTKVQGAQPSEVFTIKIASPASGVLECSVSVTQGSNTCQ